MRLLAFIVFVLVMVLATCSAPRARPLPAQTDVPVLPTNTERAPTPRETAFSSKDPEAAFESQTYLRVRPIS